MLPSEPASLAPASLEPASLVPASLVPASTGGTLPSGFAASTPPASTGGAASGAPASTLGPAQIGKAMALPSIVTAPVRASARPDSFAPVVSVMLASARTLPPKTVVEILRADEQRRAHDDRRERITEIVTEDAEGLIAKVLGRPHVASDSLRQSLVDRLVEARHTDGIRALVLPEAEDAGAEGAILRHEVTELEAVLDPQRRVDAADRLEPLGASAALRFLGLFGAGLPGPHVVDHVRQDLIDVIPQRESAHVAFGHERSRELLPVGDDRDSLGVDELREAVGDGRFGCGRSLAARQSARRPEMTRTRTTITAITRRR